MNTETLTSARAALAEAQAHVVELEAAAIAEDRAALTRQLDNVHIEIRDKTARKDQLKALALEQREARNNVRARLQRDDEAIGDNLSEQPAVAEYLPHDPDVVRWKKHHDELVAKRAEHQSMFDALPDPEPTIDEAARLDAALLQLRFAESNLIRAIEGKSTKSFVQGASISGVR